MKTINQLKQFREEVYQSVRRSADGLLNLMDALSSQTSARSVAELSLEPAFERQYSSVYQAIGDFEVKGDKQQEKEKTLLRVIGGTVSEPERNRYWLFGTDGTPAPRPYARTMEDRGFVYQPNVVRGNKPVTIGHSYSILGYLPERGESEPNWIVPLMVKRIKTQETDIAVGLKQLAMLMTDDKLPWSGGMCVHVADTKYGTADVRCEENWWLIAQLAYVQLWLARYLADYLPRPWERYLPPPRSSVASPSATQRAFRRIIGLLGSPARSPKPRGYSPGRPKGACLKPRERFSVVKKAA